MASTFQLFIVYVQAFNETSLSVFRLNNVVFKSKHSV